MSGIELEHVKSLYKEAISCHLKTRGSTYNDALIACYAQVSDSLKSDYGLSFATAGILTGMARMELLNERKNAKGR